MRVSPSNGTVVARRAEALSVQGIAGPLSVEWAPCIRSVRVRISTSSNRSGAVVRLHEMAQSDAHELADKPSAARQAERDFQMRPVGGRCALGGLGRDPLTESPFAFLAFLQYFGDCHS